MNLHRKAKITGALKIFSWSILGAAITSFFFLTTFLSDFSPLPIIDAGAMFFGPLFCGIVLGIILKEFEIPALAASVIILTTFAIIFIGIIIIFPALQSPDAMTILVNMEAPKFIALSAILVFPLALIGMVIGKALGETILLTEKERHELKTLRREAKEWHEELEKK